MLIYESKMPHSKLKGRLIYLDSGVLKCPCGQTFNYRSVRDLNMKLRLHCKFFTKLAEGIDQLSTPKKAIMLTEETAL